VRTKVMVVGLIMVCTTGLAAQGRGPKGATAKCINGKYSTSKSMRSACKDDFGIAVWYGVLPQEGPSTTPAKPDVFVKLEALLAQEPPYSVFRADKDGVVILRSADSAKVAQYSSLIDYLDKEHQESACRRASNHCVTCTIPGHRIYCTNVAQFLPLPAF
jgi:hypothetical protein